jgi:hypothetical protein
VQTSGVAGLGHQLPAEALGRRRAFAQAARPSTQLFWERERGNRDHAAALSRLPAWLGAPQIGVCDPSRELHPSHDRTLSSLDHAVLVAREQQLRNLGELPGSVVLAREHPDDVEPIRGPFLGQRRMHLAEVLRDARYVLVLPGGEW